MRSQVLADTGALVALVSPRDPAYRSCSEALRTLSRPLLTCWPVLTEAAWLVRTDPRGLPTLFDGFEQGLLSLLTLDEEALPWLSHFLARYSDLKPQLADACLVYLAEREGIDTVFTLDRRDFSVYRLTGKRPFKIIP